MTTIWPKAVVGTIGAALTFFGLLNLMARNWLWGDAGYSVEARQPIMFLGLISLTIGAAVIKTAYSGTPSQLQLAAGALLPITAATPLIMTLNIAGYDRLYNTTQTPLIYIAVTFAALVTTPTLLAYLALRKN